MSKMLRLILCSIFVFVGSECAKILAVFPGPSICQQNVFRPLMIELARRGHEITVITTDPAFPKDQAPSNLTEINVHNISYGYIPKVLKKNGTENEEFDINTICDMNLKLVDMQLQSDEVQEYIRNNKNIDLLFVESFIRPTLIYSFIYDAPVIEFSSCGFLSTYLNIGAASHPIFYPDTITRRVYNLTFWDKITKLYNFYSSNIIYDKHADTESEWFKKVLGQDVPNMNVLRSKIHMTFLNVHPIWDSNRPVPPSVVYLGGLHQKPQKELPQELKSYLDSSKYGVIYISFDTNVQPVLFPPETLKILTDVISKLPYDVLWKWDGDELPGRPHNVKISKWLPQSDLLRHPKIKLFITQGDLQSTDEAIEAGVPLVGLPMFGDQWFNVEQYNRFTIGKGLLIETMSEKQLMDAIRTVISDERYRQNIAKLRDIVNDQPLSPLERAVWWTEYVLRHGGGTHLRANGAGVSWTDYYELDLALLLFAVITVVLAKNLMFDWKSSVSLQSKLSFRSSF
ncbi:UDP-glucosyltransferase 2-like [Melitaea cinxia]|uniref:UDP-glucosyltransferase 2-like n=1 Tax=Melitaea cinxia TaxID=113334 RepID=UPI001E2745EE|nr:UDP-glucosyltransferase 2-like [Melitaea cinxia]